MKSRSLPRDIGAWYNGMAEKGAVGLMHQVFVVDESSLVELVDESSLVDQPRKLLKHGTRFPHRNPPPLLLFLRVVEICNLLCRWFALFFSVGRHSPARDHGGPSPQDFS